MQPLNRRSFLPMMAGATAITTGDAALTPHRAEEAFVANVRDFGAVGDGKADDTHAIQAAIDHALARRWQVVHMPSGTYRTTDTINLGYGETYTTLSLVGEPTFAYNTSTGVLIVPEASDRPALNIQGARGTLIQGISFRGRNFSHVYAKLRDFAAIADADPAGWLDPALTGALERYRPYAAIAVDAFTVPGYPRPPLPQGKPEPERRAFSSDIVIDRCWIGGFAAAVAVQPCDADGNGDYVKVTRCSIEHCVYGIAVGNTQSRNVAIRDCTYAGVHTFVTTTAFGRRRGMLGGPIDNVSGGRSYQFIDALGAFASAVTVSHLYFEAQTRIGRWSVGASFNNPLVFQTCTFTLGEHRIGTSPAAMLDCAPRSTVRFVGCTFTEARRILHLVGGADSVTVESCSLGVIGEWRNNTFGSPYQTLPRHIARALDYTCGGVFLHGSVDKGEIALSGTIGLSFDDAGAGNLSVVRGETISLPRGGRTVVHHYARALVDRYGRRWSIVGRTQPLALRKTAAPVRTLRVVGDELQIVLDAAEQLDQRSRFRPGDLLYDDASGTVLAVADVEPHESDLTVRATLLNNITGGDRVSPLVDISKGDGYLWLYHANQMVSDAVYFGDFRAGDKVVANVHVGDGSAAGLDRALEPGDLLHHCTSGPPLAAQDRPQPYGPLTSIVAVDERGRTVTLDRPATTTARFQISTVALA